MDARTLNPHEYRAALAALSTERSNGEFARDNALVLQKLHTRYPDLAAGSRVAAKEKHAALIRELVYAQQQMDAAHLASKSSAENPSQLERDRTAERLIITVSTHDALLRQVEQSHAALSAPGAV